MPDLEALKNRGILPIGEAVPSGEKTLVVVGAARSGTSIVAGALAKMGIFMGDRAVPPVFEDVRLAKALEASNSEAAAGIITEYNRRQPVWGFKRPGIIPHLEAMHALLRNPVYLFVFRDPVAIASRCRRPACGCVRQGAPRNHSRRGAGIGGSPPRSGTSGLTNRQQPSVISEIDFPAGAAPASETVRYACIGESIR